MGVIFTTRYNGSFHLKMESVHCKAALAVTGTIRGTFREKLYQKQGLESIRKRRWYRNVAPFPKYLKVNLQSIFSKYFLALAKHIIQELIRTFPT